MDGLEQNNKLTREQKIGITMLFIFALLTVGLAFLQIRNTLVTPFVLRTKNSEEKSLKDFQVTLQNVDTDQDGLNDYEELNFYTTSPYLPDTDSDGRTDKQEIDAGTNPLCVEGQNCQTADAATSDTTSTPPTLLQTPLSQLSALSASSPENASQIEALLNDPRQIREMLKQTGQIPEAQLNKLDDATLVKLLKQILYAQPQKSTALELESNPVSQTESTTVSSTVEKPK